MKSIEDRIANIKAAIDNPPVRTPIDWNTFIDAHKSIFPQIESGELFEYQSECDVEVIPEWDDDDEKWFTYAYSYDIGRDEDGLYVKVNMFDGDCSWDEVDFFTEENVEEFYKCYSLYFNSDDYFLGWAKYHLWCAENGGGDPLEDFFHKATTVEDHLKAAEDNIRYLKM